MKTDRMKLIVTSIIILIPMGIGLCLWNQLPNEMAIHFGANQEPNGWSSKWFAVIGLPLILLGVHWFSLAVTLHDPKRANIGKKMLGLLFWIVPVISLVANGMTLLYALEKPVKIGMVLEGLVGIVFIVIGNYLSKTQQNYTVGIRIPWTLNSEDNWVKTHRMASKLWMIAGILMLGNIFWQQEWILLSLIVIVAIVPVGYSFLLYKMK